MGFIHFFKEDVKFPLDIDTKKKGINWIQSVIAKEGKRIENLNYIFCSDKYLQQLNVRYLNHDTYTDVIAFDHSISPEIISGDIFISIERVKENCAKYNNSFLGELYRVMVHGVLHLLGYSDKKSTDKALMRQMEDKYLGLILNS